MLYAQVAVQVELRFAAPVNNPTGSVGYEYESTIELGLGAADCDRIGSLRARPVLYAQVAVQVE